LRRTIIGNTPNAHIRMAMRSVLGRNGIANVCALKEDTPPAFHVFQKIVEAHTGRADGRRISWSRWRRRTARARGSYVCEEGGTGGAERADRVDVIARTGCLDCGGDVAGVAVDIIGR
jgi:hypothetical protein